MSTPPVSRTSPKKHRKPQAKTQMLWNAILEVAGEYRRMSVRQLFYQLVSRGYVEKTERAYKRIADTSVQMRLAGTLPYNKIVDGNRERRRVLMYGEMQEALDQAHEAYRRNYWISQPVNVEVWCEKDALSGVINPICQRYGVPYVATRGFPSLTLRHETAEWIRASGKPTVILYVGDHDASGRKISDNLQDELRQFGDDVPVQVVRLALNPDQIRRYGLPTRPGKRTDSRHRAFAEQYGDASVEIDALPPDVLTDLIEDAILDQVDLGEWERVQHIEQLERQTLGSIAALSPTPGTVYVNDEGASA